MPHFGSEAIGLDCFGISLFTKEYCQCLCLGYIVFTPKRKKKKKETNWLAVKELKDRVGSGSMKTREIK